MTGTHRRQRAGATVVPALLLTLLGAPALAAAEGHAGPTLSELLWQAGNLALLLGVIFYFARKPIQKFFADRRDAIRGELDEAAQLLEQAESRYAEWQRKLIALDDELETIRATSRQRAEEERESILADARDGAERIQRDASAAVEQELRRAQAQLRREASDLAVELAEKILKEEVSDGDRDRLMDEFISRVERASSPSSPSGAGG